MNPLYLILFIIIVVIFGLIVVTLNHTYEGGDYTGGNTASYCEND